jgi:hypothetical protein
MNESIRTLHRSADLELADEGGIAPLQSDPFEPVPLTELPVDWVAVRYWVEVIALTVLAGAFVWQVVG